MNPCIAAPQPGPIDSPGAAGLQATADPAATDALCLVADGSGGHAFDHTLEEHQRTVQHWAESAGRLDSQRPLCRSGGRPPLRHPC